MRKLENNELHRLDREAFEASAKSPIIVILDNVRSHLNVGSIFRTSDAFRIEKIYLCGITGTPPHRDIQKTALGATDTVAWEYVEDTVALVGTLKAQGVTIASIEQAEGAIMLDKFDASYERLAVVFGNEVDGVNQSIVHLSDFVIEIPQFGSKHSLNIAVSAGITIWELTKPHFLSIHISS